MLRAGSSNVNGVAAFKISGAGGFYVAAGNEYREIIVDFGPNNSVLSQTIAWF